MSRGQQIKEYLFYPLAKHINFTLKRRDLFNTLYECAVTISLSGAMWFTNVYLTIRKLNL